MEPLPLEPPPAPAPAAPQYPAENGAADQYPEGSAVALTRMFPLDAAADKMFPNENGASAASRLYHSDDSAVRRMYQRESGALRRMYHSLSDYGMYPAYLSGLGLSTIAPSEPGEAARPPPPPAWSATHLTCRCMDPSPTPSPPGSAARTTPSPRSYLRPCHDRPGHASRSSCRRRDTCRTRLGMTQAVCHAFLSCAWLASPRDP